MHNQDETPPARFPSLRVWLCGPFRMEWVDPISGDAHPVVVEEVQGKDVVPALSLLKLLLCHPERQAPRDWIMEQFWPENVRSVAVHRLENVFSVLRKLLRPPAGGASLVFSTRGKKQTGLLYGLAAYPHLWSDVDALTWQVEQAARMERFGDDSLPYWERAFTLLKRGSFLADERYADWVNERRELLAGLSRQCVHALWRLYVQRQGEAGKAEALLVLRTYWQQHRTDEDALRPLMELLGEQERYQEAEEYYQQLLVALAELGPGEDGHPRVPDARTRDIREYLRTKQIQRNSSPSPIYRVGSSAKLLSISQNVISTKPQVGIANVSSSLQRVDLGAFTSSIEVTASQAGENGQDWGAWFGSKLVQLITVVDHWVGQATYCDHLQALLDQEILEFEAMKPQLNDGPYVYSRRQALITIAALPVALWTSVQQGITSASMTEKLLTRCAASITALWHLLKGSELSFIEQTLSTYLLTLVTLAQQPSPYQKTAARLTSQAYRLYGIIALHRNNLKARENYCQQALYFSEIAESASLVVSAHISLASTFYYEGNPVKATQVYQKALQQEKEIFPLQRARLYAELAVVYAQQKQEQDALSSLRRAQDMYPDYPETDPSFFYAEFTPASMVLEKGLTYLALAYHFPDCDYEQDAWNSFAQIEKLQIENAVPERILFEIANHQAETAIRLGNMELFQDYLEKGIEGANRLRSIQRYQEISEIYTHARKRWPHEMKIERIKDLFR